MNKINIIYLNNTEKFASGGSKIIYNHSRIINTYYLKKFNSEILHIKRKKVSKYINSLTKRFFKSKDYGWKFSDICASKNFKSKLFKDDIKFKNSLNFNYQKDFIIIPEICGFIMEQVTDLPCAKVVLCQAYDHMMETLQPKSKYTGIR